MHIYVVVQFDLMIFPAALALASYVYTDIWSCVSGIPPNDHSFYLVLIALGFIWYLLLFLLSPALWSLANQP
jgi:hypothetical protein